MGPARLADASPGRLACEGKARERLLGGRWIAVSTEKDNLEVVLRGAPSGIPEADKIKIMHAGGYEHFERVRGEAGNRSGDAGKVGAEALTFQWVTRTEIAE
jgi:hypothetical protein